jgi:hypothetical protein
MLAMIDKGKRHEVSFAVVEPLYDDIGQPPVDPR